QRLEASAAAHLLGAHITGRRKPRPHRLLFRAPAGDGVFGHETLSASSCRSFRIPESNKPAGANLRSNRTRLATRPAVYRRFGRAALAACSTTSATTPGSSAAASTSFSFLPKAARTSR